MNTPLYVSSPTEDLLCRSGLFGWARFLLGDTWISLSRSCCRDPCTIHLSWADLIQDSTVSELANSLGFSILSSLSRAPDRFSAMSRLSIYKASPSKLDVDLIYLSVSEAYCQDQQAAALFPPKTEYPLFKHEHSMISSLPLHPRFILTDHLWETYWRVQALSDSLYFRSLSTASKARKPF